MIGLKDTRTGDTLSDQDKPIVLENIDFPDPVIFVAIEPKTKQDQEKLGTALGKLSEEDPTFQYRTDEETNQTIISGMGELHLEIIVDRLKESSQLVPMLVSLKLHIKKVLVNQLRRKISLYVKQVVVVSMVIAYLRYRH